MLHIPVIRWGKPYESLETQPLHHFLTGEPIAVVSQANGGLVSRDMRSAWQARARLREFNCGELLEKVAVAAHLYENGDLPLGNERQSADDFVFQQSATTGLPQHMCRANIAKNAFVLRNMREILDALTRGLDLDIFSNGFGMESRGVVVSYQAQSPVLGAVLPSNSPGVHTLWLPVIPLQLGLVLKPGSAEPWTAYRIYAAFVEAGIPAEAVCLYPGGHDVGSAVLNGCRRSMIFGSQQTVEQYASNRGVQVHGPGFSKILIGDDCVDRWEEYLDLMVESVFINGGRSCINASGIWASRHTEQIATAIAERLGPIEALPPDHPEAGLAAFTIPGTAPAIKQMIDNDLKETGVTDLTAKFGNRLVEHSRCAFLRPMVVHCDSPDHAIAQKEFMFPFVSVVKCPQAQMINKIGPTLVGTALTDDADWISQLGDATNIDRLNVGPIPTNRLNWLQPHEGNLIDFLFRSRAYQTTRQLVAAK
ncbi:MAG TPA: aldehyde dehydrogenase family protein [Pirellulaceae bacterium]|nr:aldehyde dehydrogenase family protein [Pirellulaceae bacterium]HMO93167.1 aldehyde dehydrogenase family protein [Pirellulaceae bacterium]HMP70004.1 aldehyde dehydrogenase family protein [Pirellulaceae bacterium]